MSPVTTCRPTSPPATASTRCTRRATEPGRRIGIVTLAALDPGAPQYFWQNVANVPTTGRTVTVDNVDGGPGAPSDASGSGETDLDVEQSGGAGARRQRDRLPGTEHRPRIHRRVLHRRQPERRRHALVELGRVRDGTSPAAVAAGEETDAYEAAFDEAFLELAAQGQSGFVSAGDAAAYDASGDLGTTNLSVDTPADSPYITARGGTTHAVERHAHRPRRVRLGHRPGPSAPGAGTTCGSRSRPSPARRYAEAATANVVGGGGGFSVVEPEPSYQTLVSGTRTITACST